MSERHLLLGVTGGIAAYKAPIIIRLLQKQGIAVRTVVTEHALQFVTRVTLESLTGFPVACDLFEKQEHSFEHIELAKWTDVVAIAPATANCIAKFACGVADDLLSTIYVAIQKPIVLAPAMNESMMTDRTVGRNLRTLQEAGVKIVRPGSGYLACGDIGPGRMSEPEEIVDIITSCFRQRSTLDGKNVLITAGATRESIDPVRFITNRSSGKMGYAIAQAFAMYGADVTLISGHTALYPPSGVEFVSVESAQQMYEAVMERHEQSDVIIKAAAVADFTPEHSEDNKIKKTGDDLTITLKRTKDILAALGENKRPGQILIGFSAETQNHVQNSVKKLNKKNLDLIVLNDVASKDSGFQVDTNRVMFISKGNASDAADEKNVVHSKEVDGVEVNIEATPLLNKFRIAEMIALKAIKMIDKTAG